MKLLPKFALLSIGVAAVPLAIAGYSSIRVSQAALRVEIEGHEVLLARQISEYVNTEVANLRPHAAGRASTPGRGVARVPAAGVSPERRFLGGGHAGRAG